MAYKCAHGVYCNAPGIFQPSCGRNVRHKQMTLGRWLFHGMGAPSLPNPNPKRYVHTYTYIVQRCTGQQGNAPYAAPIAPPGWKPNERYLVLGGFQQSITTVNHDRSEARRAPSQFVLNGPTPSTSNTIVCKDFRGMFTGRYWR